MREVDRLFTQKALVPKMFVAYDRTAYTAKDGSDLRITFDAGLRSRAHSLRLTDTAQSTPYFADGTRIMEVKTKHGMPLWLTSALTSHRIYPSSFSKYGKIYQQYTTRSLTHA
jgi:SPX domain protein involved in polyphosphate accumulation